MFLLDLRAIPPAPWQHGQAHGMRYALASYPPNSSDPADSTDADSAADSADSAAIDASDWRASVVEQTSDGPLPQISGYDRSIMLLDGAGMQLNIADGRQHRLQQRWQSYVLHADEAAQVTLAAGPVKSFELLLRRDVVEARVDLLSDAGVFEPAQESLLLFVLAGSWRIKLGEQAQVLSGQQALLQYVAHAAFSATLLEGGSRLLCVRLRTRRAPSQLDPA